VNEVEVAAQATAIPPARPLLRGVLHGVACIAAIAIGRAALTSEDDRTVDEAMSAGPSTVRPSLELDRAVERMRRQELTTLPVTSSDGRLLGLLERDTAERALRELNRESARTLSESSQP
jgi:Mg/Co/Ni transporter MgtE